MNRIYNKTANRQQIAHSTHIWNVPAAGYIFAILVGAYFRPFRSSPCIFSPHLLNFLLLCERVCEIYRNENDLSTAHR